MAQPKKKKQNQPMCPARDQQAEHLILPEGTVENVWLRLHVPHELSHSEMQTGGPCHYLPSNYEMTRLKILGA